MTTAQLERPTIIAPERSPAQRERALKRANRVRCYRAGLKLELKAGRVHVVDVILGLGLSRRERDLVATMKIAELLLAAPSLGRVKVNKLLVQARISPSRSLAALTARQRSELARLIRR